LEKKGQSARGWKTETTDRSKYGTCQAGLGSLWKPRERWGGSGGEKKKNWEQDSPGAPGGQRGRQGKNASDGSQQGHGIQTAGRVSVRKRGRGKTGAEGTPSSKENDRGVVENGTRGCNEGVIGQGGRLGGGLWLHHTLGSRRCRGAKGGGQRGDILNRPEEGHG